MSDVVDAIHLLRRGPEVWNSKRTGLQTAIDLAHIEIRNASLRGARLNNVNFDGSTLMNVDLRQTDLRRSRLNGVRMMRVLLDDADLGSAELKGTDFDQVSMRQARLDHIQSFELKIRRSDLTGVKLRSALLRWFHLYNSDLSEVVLADPDVETVVLKRVVMSEDVLRRLASAGCRIEMPNDPLRDDWPDLAPIRSRSARDAYITHEGHTYWFSVNRWDFFICHSSLDKESFVRPLAEALEGLRQRVWYDELEINAGDPMETVIDHGIAGANFGVVVLSPTFIGRRWTEREVASLAQKAVFIVLHEVDVDELERLAPALTARFTLNSNTGPQDVAAKLVEAVSKPPGEL